MRMIDLGNQRGPLCIIDTSTSVDCTKELRFPRRSLRSLVECMVPCFAFHQTLDTSPSTTTTSTSTITGTFFGYRKGHVIFSLQSHPNSLPLLLLQFSIPTSFLAKEMQYGLLRIALESNQVGSISGPLFSVPVWTLYCNGRRVGYALKRQVTEGDVAVLKMMKLISVGAGVLPGLVKKESGDPMMYLRARFERVVGSADSESFHMLNPVGSSGQELSIFLLRS